MSGQPTRLLRVATKESIEATLESDLSVDDLFEAELLWAPARIRTVQSLFHARVSRGEWPESLHWNWALKADDIGLAGLGGLSHERAFGIRAEGKWQGMLLGTSVGHPTRTVRHGLDQIYVEYVEVAPWNWDVAKIHQVGTFRGIGRQLVEIAIRWSRAEELRGRLGLHALPQAEDFYRIRCGMTDLGPDPNCQRFRYFEMTEDQATAFLMENES